MRDKADAKPHQVMGGRFASTRSSRDGCQRGNTFRQQHLQAIITVLSLVNPAVCAAMFAKIECGRARCAQFKDATKVSFAVLLILLLAALVGLQFLHQFGISLDAFKVAGGIVLCWMGFTMLNAKQEDASSGKA